MSEHVDQLKETLARARAEVAKVIIGQPQVVDLALIAIFTGHHALVEGVRVARALAGARAYAGLRGDAADPLDSVQTPDQVRTWIRGAAVASDRRAS